MSIDNVSQTSDYSSSSEISAALRPTIVPSYRSHSQGSISLSERIAASRMNELNSGTTLHAYPQQSRSARNHNSYQLSSQQYNPSHSLRGSASSHNNSPSDVMYSQVKALICENATLKKEVQVLHGKCQKIEDCEKQFTGLQVQYEEFVKTSTNRQALERELRAQLEADLRQARSVHSHVPLFQSTVTTSTQTASNIAIENSNRNREQQLIMEISALRLMLREKEELILSLLSERHSKSTTFCPQDYDSEDYIASNIVSL